MFRHGAPIAALLALGALLFLHRLGDRELTSSHEARAAQNARSILTEGTWGLPHLLDRHVELQKPPLYYWLAAAISWLRDRQVDAWSVRLPAALSALGCLLFLYVVGFACGRPRAGFLAAVLLATSLHFTWLGRVGRIDMPLTFTTTLVLGGFYLGSRRGPSWPWFLGAYLGLGLGLLLKGPIALALPAAAAGWLLLLERVRRLRETTWIRCVWPGLGLRSDGLAGPTVARRFVVSLSWGMPLVLAIAAPWYVWVNLNTDFKQWNVFFWYHNVERGFGSATLASHPMWFYLPRLGADLLPWSAVIPVAGWYFIRKRRWHGEPEACFGLGWFLAMLALLSCMRFKRADYLAPAYPGLALWLGFVADRWFLERRRSTTSRHWALLLSPRALGLATVLCAAAWLGYVEWIEPVRESSRPYRRFAEEIRRRTQLPVIFFRAEAHELAFHVGPPLDTILEWENLDVWATQPQTIYVVMPADCARSWRANLDKGCLEEVLASADLVERNRERPLLLMRSVPRAGRIR